MPSGYPLVPRVKRDPWARFSEKISGAGDLESCWVWTSTIDKDGYAAFSFQGKQVKAARWAYEFMLHDIPKGLHLDHLCRTRSCVNPWHLDPVTPRVNFLRGNQPGTLGARQRAKVKCPQGHPYDEENTRVRSSGARTCRACEKAKPRSPRKLAK